MKPNNDIRSRLTAAIEAAIPDAVGIIAAAQAAESTHNTTPSPSSRELLSTPRGSAENKEHEIARLFWTALVELCLLEGQPPTAEIAKCFSAAMEMYNECINSPLVKQRTIQDHPLLQAFGVTTLDALKQHKFIIPFISDQTASPDGQSWSEYTWTIFSEAWQVAQNSKMAQNDFLTMIPCLDVVARVARGKLSVLQPNQKYDIFTKNFLAFIEKNGEFKDPALLTRLVTTSASTTHACLLDVQRLQKIHLQNSASKSYISGFAGAARHLRQVRQHMYSGQTPLSADATVIAKLNNGIKESANLIAQQSIPGDTDEDKNKQATLANALNKAMREKLDYHDQDNNFGMTFRTQLQAKLKQIGNKIDIEHILTIYNNDDTKLAMPQKLNSSSNEAENLDLLIRNERTLCKALREYVRKGGALGTSPAHWADPGLKEMEQIIRDRELALDVIEYFNSPGYHVGMILAKALAVTGAGIIIGSFGGAVLFGTAVGAMELINAIINNTPAIDPYQQAFDAISQLLQGDNQAFMMQLNAGNPIIVITMIAAISGLIGLVTALISGAHVASEIGGPSAYKEVLHSTLPYAINQYIGDLVVKTEVF